MQDLNHNVKLHNKQSLPLDHVLVVGSLTQHIHLNLFSLADVINNLHISSHKMTSVGLEPQWYSTQHRPYCQTSRLHGFKLFFIINTLLKPKMPFDTTNNLSLLRTLPTLRYFHQTISPTAALISFLLYITLSRLGWN